MASRNITRMVNRDTSDVQGAYYTYLDFQIVNSTQDGTRNQLIFKDTKAGNIIENSGDYLVAVNRFHLSTINLPVAIPIIQFGSDPNKTVYSFTLSYKTNAYQAFLEFIPQNQGVSVKPPTTGQDMSNEYYFVSNYNYFVELMNTTLQTAYNGLKNSADLPSSVAPYLIYDPSTRQLVFNADTNYDVKANADPIYIYMNNKMRRMLSGFETINFGEKQPNGMNYRLNIYNNNNYNILQQADGSSILQSYEQYNSILTWNPIACVALEAYGIPLNQTNLPDPIQYGTNNTLQALSTNLQRPYITDFTVSPSDEYLPAVDYTAGNNHRWIDLVGHQPIGGNIEIRVIWRDKYGNSYPLYLSSDASADLKLVFIRKDIKEYI